MGLGTSQKNECRERRGSRIEPWTTTTGRSLWVEKKSEMEKNKSAGQCGVQESKWRKSLRKGRFSCANVESS